jgi:hypothetical protein
MRDAPAAVNSGSQETAAAPAGRQVVQSQRTGDPLPASSNDAPGHSPAIAWPQPAQGTDHKPMRLK